MPRRRAAAARSSAGSASTGQLKRKLPGARRLAAHVERRSRPAPSSRPAPASSSRSDVGPRGRRRRDDRLPGRSASCATPSRSCRRPMKADGPTLESVLDSQDETLYRVTVRPAGAAGKPAPHRPTSSTVPSGDLFGLTQNAGMGWNPAELGRPRVPDPQHAGRPARRRRHADRARLSHRPLGGRPARAGGGRGAARAGRASRSPASAPTPATAARRARPGCSTACPTATTPRSCCAG